MLLTSRSLHVARSVGIYEAEPSEAVVDDVNQVYLPNFSDRLEVLRSTTLCSFGRTSQRVLRAEFTLKLSRVISLAMRCLQKLLLGLKFRHWYTCINRDWVSRRTYKRFYPKLLSDNVTEIWPHRKGLQIIVPYYMEMYHKAARRAMRRWKMYVREVRMLLFRLLGKWRIKTARIRLNRMNAARFLQLTQPLGKKIRHALRKYHWPRFRHACDLVLIRRHVRLLFRCWRTVVEAMRRGRRLVKHRTLQLLMENVAEEREREATLFAACAALRDRAALRTAYWAWVEAQRRRLLIKRVLVAYCQGSLWRAWAAWVKNTLSRRPSSPRSPRPKPRPVPPPPVPHVYRRRGSRLPPVPPHIVVPLMGLQSYAMVHNPKLTDTDRIAFRIHRAARLDAQEEHREKPEVVTEIHAELAHESFVHALAEMSVQSRSATPEAAHRSLVHTGSRTSTKPSPGTATPKNSARPGSAQLKRSSPKAGALNKTKTGRPSSPPGAVAGLRRPPRPATASAAGSSGVKPRSAGTGSSGRYAQDTGTNRSARSSLSFLWT